MHLMRKMIVEMICGRDKFRLLLLTYLRIFYRIYPFNGDVRYNFLCLKKASDLFLQFWMNNPGLKFIVAWKGSIYSFEKEMFN